MDKFLALLVLPMLLAVIWVANFIHQHGREILIILAVLGIAAAARYASWRYWNVGTVTSGGHRAMIRR